MDRTQWQQFAERWLIDARELLDRHRWSAAYYVAGYAVECGLKACVLVRVGATPEVIFNIQNFSADCWTHNVTKLVKQANLEAERIAAADAQPVLGKNWLVVKDWSERARYETHSHQKAKKLYAAITDPADGVMPWIRSHW